MGKYAYSSSAESIQKGIDMLTKLLPALQNEPDLHLIVAGPDQVGYQAHLQQRAFELDIEDQHMDWHALRSVEAGYFDALSFFVCHHIRRTSASW